MKTVELLRQLQAVDSALDANRERLGRVEAELADRSEVLAARRARAEREAALKPIEADQRDLELEIDTLRGQLDEIEKKLYGGRIGDAKELNNLNREANQFKALISTREDRLLELLVAAEQAASDLAAAEDRLRQIEAARRALEAGLTEERGQLRTAIEGGQVEQSSLREGIDAAALRTYDNLRRSRGGLAVAEIRQRTCQGCRISLPASEEQRARHGSALVLCQSCGRILYAAL